MQGKIECVAPMSSLSIGALVSYEIKNINRTYFVSDIKTIYIPLWLAQLDILFFHHVLELVDHFTFMGNYLHKVFDLIELLYSMEYMKMTLHLKKIFLLQLLTSMDIMPEAEDMQTHIIKKLSIIDMQQIDKIVISLSDEKELDKWLWYCVWQHPYVNKFKTVHFLAKNRAL